MPEFTIPRGELVELVARASEGCAQSTRDKLIAVAETTDAVAAGWWHCDGVSCVSRQAGRRNQTFQMAYDKAIAERYDLAFDGNGSSAVVVGVVE